MKKTFNKILVANRGEIAVRIIKSAKKMGIKTATIYASNDSESLHVSYADEAFVIDGENLADTYLNIDKIVNIAKKTGCEAIHPGYGFLAENPQFVRSCNNAQIVFIGPEANVMNLMGNKIEARKFAVENNIPVIQGTTGTIDELVEASKKIQFPVLIKAAAGGGGKGMRVVYEHDKLREAIESTSRQAKSYFGDETVFVEKYVDQPRHIEVQVIADHFGNVVHLFERECTIQRRHQKIIEEAPSPTLTDEVRTKMYETAVFICKSIGYKNAGTIEFLVDKDLNFFFLEMNTRIQVEHPVTEFISGVDIVEEQISIAAGNKLSFSQNDLKINGNALEFRIYAEEPENNFLPSPGKLTFFKKFESENIRVDTGIKPLSEIKSSYDPMIAKLIVHESDRKLAIKKMSFALDNFIVQGIKTNVAFLKSLINTSYFIENKVSVNFTEEKLDELNLITEKLKEELSELVPVVAFALFSTQNISKNNIWENIGFWRNSGSVASFVYNNSNFKIEFMSNKDTSYNLLINQKEYKLCCRFDSNNELRFNFDDIYYNAACSEDSKGNGFVTINGLTFNVKRKDVLPKEISVNELLESSGIISNEIKAPMPGKVVKIFAQQNQDFKKGEVMLILESMKMENSIEAAKDCKIKFVNVQAGQMVETSTILIETE